jgi:MauM/NapG family ferredoxin protein
MLFELLRALLRRNANASPLRPPGAVDEHEFLRRCIKCGKCTQVCADRSIRPGTMRTGRYYGTPMISARDVPCYLCMECPPVCPTGALDPGVTEAAAVKMGVAVIDEELCFAFNGIICRACFDHCPFFREGITMRDEHYPVVNPDVCVGCGICVHVCVADDRPAITVVPVGGAVGRRTFLRAAGPRRVA